MKKTKNMKERMLSIVLTLAMVVSLFAGMAPVEVQAEESSIYNVIDEIDIAVNPDFLEGLASGTYNKGTVPFVLGDGSKDICNFNTDYDPFLDETISYDTLYCGNTQVYEGDEVDLENNTYYVMDQIEISNQETMYRFANVISAASGDENFSFEIAMAGSEDDFLQYNFFVWVTYKIKPGTGGENPSTPEGETFISEVNIQVDWNKVPALVEGSREVPDLDEVPATIEGNKAQLYGAAWGVKLNESFLIKAEDKDYDNILGILGEEGITSYNEYIEAYMSLYGWGPLEEVIGNPCYTINNNDTYVLFIGVEAKEGYTFNGSVGEEYAGEVISNVTVGCKLLDDDDGHELAIGLELGTLAEMEESKNEAAGTVNPAPTPGGGGFGGGGSSSGGTTGGTQITVPVKNPETTVNVTAKVEENKATVDSIKTEDLAKITDTKEETTIEIDLTGLDKTIDTVVIPTESMEKVAQAATDTTNKVEGLTIKLSTATVTLDAKALSAVVGQADGENIQLNVDDVHTARLNDTQMKAVEKLDVHKGVEAYFTCNGKRIGDFKGGEVTVELPFEVPAGYKPEGFSVWYVDDKGNTTKYKSTYKDGKLSFVVDHFSDFIVVYDAADAELATVVENTTFRYLRLKGKKATKNSITLEWNKVADADGYILYGNKCNANGKKYTLKKIKTITDADTTKLVVKDLKKGTYYKYYVKAYKLVDGEKVFLGKSKVVHVTTTGGKYGNAKAVEVNKTEVSLKVGKTFTIKAKQIKEDKKIAGHTDIKYESSNSAVAKVNKNGKITAKKKGTATIYVYAQNGIYKKVKVTVK